MFKVLQQQMLSGSYKMHKHGPQMASLGGKKESVCAQERGEGAPNPSQNLKITHFFCLNQPI
jgi:hypothetical protein